MTTTTSQEEQAYSITSNELREVRERLQYVVEKTESAALRTLDESTKSLEKLTTVQSALSANESSETSALSEIEIHLRNIICLQEYQDLCSQTLSRAIALLDGIESNSRLSESRTSQQSEDKDGADDQQSFGPAFRSDDSEEHINSQADIDDLFEQHRAG